MAPIIVYHRNGKVSVRMRGEAPTIVGRWNRSTTGFRLIRLDGMVAISRMSLRRHLSNAAVALYRELKSD